MLAEIGCFGYIKPKAALQGFRPVRKFFCVLQTGILSMSYISVEKNFEILYINYVHPFFIGRLTEINHGENGRIAKLSRSFQFLLAFVSIKHGIFT